MTADSYRFSLGKIDCIAINDYMSTYAAERFFTNAPADQLTQVLLEHDLEPDLPSAYTCLFINTGSNRVLIDTGMGTGVHPQRGPYEGKLLKVLDNEGIQAEDVDTVILTHAHGDHVGGVVDDSGRPIFSNARHVMWRDEWTFWMGDADLSAVSMPDGLKQMLIDMAKEKLRPLEGCIELISEEEEIVPGVKAIEGKGHTPGHMVILLESGQERLLYISDAVLHPLNLEYPDWHTDFYDIDIAQAAETKRRVFDWAANYRALVLAYHFYPFPSLGYVAKSEQAWKWNPLTISSASVRDMDVEQKA